MVALTSTSGIPTIVIWNHITNRKMSQLTQKTSWAIPTRECKLLGLGWSKESDTLRVVFPEEETVKTKRGILAKLAKIYDPLGLVSPLSLRAKLVYRATCEGKGAWDAALSDDLMQQWTHWENNLPAQVEVPRSLAVHRGPIKSIKLHSFGDASKSGVAACMYAVVDQASGTNQGLVTAKAWLQQRLGYPNRD